MSLFNPYRSHTEIDFPLLDVNITLPPSIKCKDSAVRMLWLNYDHVSDYCPSFHIPTHNQIKDDGITFSFAIFFLHINKIIVFIYRYW